MRISSETLMRQAAATAAEYLDAAIESINLRFGDGYAKQHSELVGAFMVVAALDYGATSLARAEE